VDLEFFGEIPIYLVQGCTFQFVSHLTARCFRFMSVPLPSYVSYANIASANVATDYCGFICYVICRDASGLLSIGSP
jgi:hypothetical protein